MSASYCHDVIRVDARRFSPDKGKLLLTLASPMSYLAPRKIWTFWQRTATRCLDVLGFFANVDVSDC